MFVFCLREDTAYLLHWQKRNRLIKCTRTTMRLFFLLQCMQALVHCKQVFEGTSAQEGDPGYFHTLKGMLGSVSWHHALWSLCRATGGAKPASGTQGPLTAFAPSPKPEHKALHKASFDLNVIGHDGTSAACSQALWATGCKSIQVSQILPPICAKSNIMQHAYLLQTIWHHWCPFEDASWLALLGPVKTWAMASSKKHHTLKEGSLVSCAVGSVGHVVCNASFKFI